MARPRAFDESVVLARSRELFAKQGYNGTSIDDLVRATGLLRGSLYKAFGSKRNLFCAALRDIPENLEPSGQSLDLLTVALMDLASDDEEVRKYCTTIVGAERAQFARLLGQNLLEKMKEKTTWQT